MLLDEIRSIKSATQELRSFGLIVGGVLGLITLWILWRHDALNLWLGAPALALMGFGVILPGALKPLQKAWMTLALLMGVVVSRVILTVLFYLVITPIGLLTRALGHDFLDRHFRTSRDSNWKVREETAYDRAAYERQF